MINLRQNHGLIRLYRLQRRSFVLEYRKIHFYSEYGPEQKMKNGQFWTKTMD